MRAGGKKERDGQTHLIDLNISKSDPRHPLRVSGIEVEREAGLEIALPLPAQILVVDEASRSMETEKCARAVGSWRPEQNPANGSFPCHG